MATGTAVVYYVITISRQITLAVRRLTYYPVLRQKTTLKTGAIMFSSGTVGIFEEVTDVLRVNAGLVVM